tara:strand:- start:327 stop:1184 length:858 start_codon:yes stop_codon:yes gene_type:complete
MSQVADYDVANAAGNVVRAELNLILDAIKTCNAGTQNNLGTTGQCQIFADTTNGKLKIRSTGGQDAAAQATFFEIGDLDTANLGLLPKSGGTLTGTLTTNDVTFAGDNHNVVWDKSDNAFEFADNAKALFGSSNDLEIFHTSGGGGQSVINENGSGDLVVQVSGSTKLTFSTGGLALNGGAASNIAALSDGATITINMATACHHSVTLGGNRTFAAPSNQVIGQSGSIFIKQDTTGSRTASFNAAFKFPSGIAPTLSIAANATDRIDYIIQANGVIHCSITLDIK